MPLQNAVKNVFTQLTATLDTIGEQEYVQPSTLLSNNSIGQHVRHIIELFQCLESGYTDGIVNYENRKRDTLIENNKDVAKELLLNLHATLYKENKHMFLEASYDDNDTTPLKIETNYYREIAYNLEHTIHHMALIRVGLKELTSLSLPDDFGVASSTVKFRKQCAQ